MILLGVYDEVVLVAPQTFENAKRPAVAQLDFIDDVSDLEYARIPAFCEYIDA